MRERVGGVIRLALFAAAAAAAAAPGGVSPSLSSSGPTLARDVPTVGHEAINEPFQPRLILTTQGINTDELRSKFAVMLRLAQAALGTSHEAPTIAFVTTAMQVPCADANVPREAMVVADVAGAPQGPEAAGEAARAGPPAAAAAAAIKAHAAPPALTMSERAAPAPEAAAAAAESAADEASAKVAAVEAVATAGGDTKKPRPESMEEAIEYARDLVLRAGLPRARVIIVDCACDGAEEMEAALAQASCIWVLGGNTFYLWHHMQRSGLDAIVRERVRRGALYVGASAGSIVAGNSISTAFWKGWDDPAAAGPNADWSSPERLRALALVPDQSFFPHYADAWETLVEKRRDDLDHGLVVLSEEGGHFISGWSE